MEKVILSLLGAHCSLYWVLFQISDDEDEPPVVDIEETVPDAFKNVELDKTRYTMQLDCVEKFAFCLPVFVCHVDSVFGGSFFLSFFNQKVKYAEKEDY